MPSEFSQTKLAEQLTQTLGVNISEQEILDAVKAITIHEPQIAKLFWQATSAEPGIYLILTGKFKFSMQAL